MCAITDRAAYTFEMASIDAQASITNDANGNLVPSVAWTLDGEFAGNCPAVGPYQVETFPAVMPEY